MLICILVYVLVYVYWYIGIPSWYSFENFNCSLGRFEQCKGVSFLFGLVTTFKNVALGCELIKEVRKEMFGLLIICMNVG